MHNLFHALESTSGIKQILESLSSVKGPYITSSLIRGVWESPLIPRSHYRAITTIALIVSDRDIQAKTKI